MRYTININFTNGSFVVLGAYSFGDVFTLMQHVFTPEVSSFPIHVNEND